MLQKVDGSRILKIEAVETLEANRHHSLNNTRYLNLVDRQDGIQLPVDSMLKTLWVQKMKEDDYSALGSFSA